MGGVCVWGGIRLIIAVIKDLRGGVNLHHTHTLQCAPHPTPTLQCAATICRRMGPGRPSMMRKWGTRPFSTARMRYQL